MMKKRRKMTRTLMISLEHEQEEYQEEENLKEDAPISILRSLFGLTVSDPM